MIRSRKRPAAGWRSTNSRTGSSSPESGFSSGSQYGLVRKRTSKRRSGSSGIPYLKPKVTISMRSEVASPCGGTTLKRRSFSSPIDRLLVSMMWSASWRGRQVVDAVVAEVLEQLARLALAGSGEAADDDQPLGARGSRRLRGRPQLD